MEAPVYIQQMMVFFVGKLGHQLLLRPQVLCHKDHALMARLDVAMKSWQDFLHNCVQHAFARTQVELNCSTADA